MKYRVTTRGWFVFAAVGILILIVLISQFNDKTEDIDSITAEQAEVNQEEHNDKNSEEANENEVADSEVTESNENEVADSEVTESNEILDAEDIDDLEEEVTQENEITEETISELDLDKKSEILFNKNISAIDEKYFSVLEEWVNILKNQDQHMIAIEGHINGYPYYADGDFGLSLAQERADIIKGYLIEKGVDGSLIKTINVGSTIQVDVSDNINNHYLNRRAIIYFIEKP